MKKSGYRILFIANFTFGALSVFSRSNMHTVQTCIRLLNMTWVTATWMELLQRLCEMSGNSQFLWSTWNWEVFKY